MIVKPQHTRTISREVYDRLDSVEKIVANQLILEGRWSLVEEANNAAA